MDDNSQPINDPYTTGVIKAEGSQAVQPLAVAQKVENEQLVVPLVEEYLEVNKQWVQSGEVLIRKHVETSTQTVPVDVEFEEVQVDRVPVNRPLAYGEKTEPWWDGDVMVVPVIEEEVVVMKRQVLREEVRIYKRRTSRQETVSDTVRSERITIEGKGNLQPISEDVSGGSVGR